MTSLSVLLVEDDEIFGEEFADFLGAFGFRTTLCASLDDVIRLAGATAFDAVLLDQFVHGRDALAILPALRGVYGGPVIIVTNNREIADRVVGLELGADDFVEKLAGPREILARIRAVMRRRLAAATALPAEPAAAPVAQPAAPAWRISVRSRRIQTPEGELVDLTAGEFDLLAYLAARRGQLVTRAEVLRAYGVHDLRAQGRAADGMISRLRTVLAPYLAGASAVKSVRGRAMCSPGSISCPMGSPPARVRRAERAGARLPRRRARAGAGRRACRGQAAARSARLRAGAPLRRVAGPFCFCCSATRTHRRRVVGLQPMLMATSTIAAQRELARVSSVNTWRTAAQRSGEE